MKLKMNILWLLMLLCLPFVSSCKEDLPAYGEAEITKVGFYHKYYGPDKDGLTGENISVNKELQCRYTINNYIIIKKDRHDKIIMCYRRCLSTPNRR
jgi:hypothetical protein